MRIWFHVILALGVHLPALGHVERAIRHQVNAQLERVYPGYAPIAFGAAGIPVYVDARRADVASACEVAQDVGCHSYDPSTVTPWIVVWAGDLWSVTLDHEVIETLTDPWLIGPEICDPVENDVYTWHGVELSNFITPTGKAAERW